MGQYWMIINIDKRLSIRPPMSKWGEFYTQMSRYDFGVLVPGVEDSWAGDRIIVIGDYTKRYPPQVATEQDGEPDIAYSEFPSVWGSRGVKWIFDSDDLEQLIVIRNLCSYEYITTRLFPDDPPSKANGSHPSLATALFTRVSWSEDSSMAIDHPGWNAGKWAGARIDMVSLNDIKNLDEWKDITEEVFKEFWGVWLDDWGVRGNCECELCLKYYALCENKGEQEEKGGDHQLNQVKGYDEAGKNAVIDSKEDNLVQLKFSSPSTHASSFDKCPREILDNIFSQVPRQSLWACSLASSTLYLAVVKILYTDVTLNSNKLTERFTTALSNRPFLRDCVHKLSALVSPHQDCVRILHGILKQLPRLVSLEIRPSWITYGDLPCSEYPFKLQELKWGFIFDDAARQFVSSQPTLGNNIARWNQQSVWDDEEEWVGI